MTSRFPRLISLILFYTFTNTACAPISEISPEKEAIQHYQLCTQIMGLESSGDCGEEKTIELTGDRSVSRITGTPLDCLHIQNQNPDLPSGTYRIDPDGRGGDPAFDALCDMATDGGGWTALSGRYLASLVEANRRYLYSLERAWYQSPSTTQVWSWDKAQMLPGDYLFGQKSLDPEGVVHCEVPELAARYAAFGIGCFLIPTNGWTIFPHGSHDPETGKTQLCQSNPGIMGSTPCPEGVQIWERRDVI